MFLINNLPKTVTIKKKRVGRGGNSGKNAGYGHKGQTKRAGKSRIGFEGGQKSLIRRTPKVKGYGFLATKKRDLAVFNLNIIDKSFEAGDKVDITSLIAKGLIDEKIKKVRIINSGELKKNLTFDETSVYLTKGVKALIAK
jgi:large subunit ribosomal protein L15